jgi:hypothetical protein
MSLVNVIYVYTLHKQKQTNDAFTCQQIELPNADFFRCVYVSTTASAWISLSLGFAKVLSQRGDQWSLLST